MSTVAFDHDPVMVDEIVEVLAQAPDGIYVDATLGGAGHAMAILKHCPGFQLVGIDRDPYARRAASQRLTDFKERSTICAGRFEDIKSIISDITTTERVSAVLFDFGVSSPQLDMSERGFTYRHDAALDMRMNPNDSLHAGDIVNGFSHAELTKIIREGGDEKFASRIAAKIIDARPITTTVELAEIIKTAIPAATRRSGGHPAKRTFQALRIAVNDELNQIPTALNDAIDLLDTDGRCCVLSYHSGEDRITKRIIEEAETGGCQCPPALPCGCGAVVKIETLRPKLRRPSDAEITANPRSRSARLRCFRKITPAALYTSA